LKGWPRKDLWWPSALDVALALALRTPRLIEVSLKVHRGFIEGTKRDGTKERNEEREKQREEERNKERMKER